jgi:hypothetical protein
MLGTGALHFYFTDRKKQGYSRNVLIREKNMTVGYCRYDWGKDRIVSIVDLKYFRIRNGYRLGDPLFWEK